MKKLLTALALLLCHLAQLHSQDMKGVLEMMGPQQRSCDVGHSSPLFRLKALGMRLGRVDDSYNGLSAERMRSMSQRPEVFENIDLSDFAIVKDRGSMGGTNVGFYVSLQPFNKKKNGWNGSRELRLELNRNSRRELAVSYARQTGTDLTYKTYALAERELALNVSYLFSTRKGKLSAYIGPTLGLGTTYNNAIRLYSASTLENGLETKAKRSTYWRGLLLAGAAIDIVPRLSLTVEAQAGMGFQMVSKAPNNTAMPSLGAHIGLRYNVVQYKKR